MQIHVFTGKLLLYCTLVNFHYSLINKGIVLRFIENLVVSCWLFNNSRAYRNTRLQIWEGFLVANLTIAIGIIVTLAILGPIFFGAISQKIATVA